MKGNTLRPPLLLFDNKEITRDRAILIHLKFPRVVTHPLDLP